MLIMTAKLSRGKIAVGVAVAAVLLLVGWKLAAGAGEPSPTATAGQPEPTGIATNEDRVAYLAACGYTAEPEPVQTQEVAIPREFNEVFTRYNRLQQAQGFDLEPYAGKHARRYVYRITDHPEGDRVMATLVIYQDTVIAADLSCTEGEGFLRALVPDADAA